MSLFGSEEAMNEYIRENPEFKGYPVALEQAFCVMNVVARDRLDFDYVVPFTRMLLAMRKLGIRGSFWWPSPISGVRFVLDKGLYWR